MGRGGGEVWGACPPRDEKGAGGISEENESGEGKEATLGLKKRERHGVDFGVQGCTVDVKKVSWHLC